jgi:hypothetical protein
VFFTQELPEDFQAVVEKWRHYRKYVSENQMTEES